MSFVIVAVSAVVGAVLTSFAEYHFKYNLVDKVVDVFRSFDARVKSLEDKVESAQKDLKNLVK